MYRYNKYKNQKVVVDEKTFDSKKEASRYLELKLLEKAGQIRGLILQPSFELIPKQESERAVKYIADFMYVENEETIVEDVKGMKTKEYILKRKIFKHKYPNYIFREI